MSGASCEGGLVHLGGLVRFRDGYPGERCSFGNVSKAKSFGSGFVAPTAIYLGVALVRDADVDRKWIVHHHGPQLRISGSFAGRGNCRKSKQAGPFAAVYIRETGSVLNMAVFPFRLCIRTIRCTPEGSRSSSDWGRSRIETI